MIKYTIPIITPTGKAFDWLLTGDNVGAYVLGDVVVGELVDGGLVYGGFVGILVGSIVGNNVGEVVVGYKVGAKLSKRMYSTTSVFLFDPIKPPAISNWFWTIITADSDLAKLHANVDHWFNEASNTSIRLK